LITVVKLKVHSINQVVPPSYFRSSLESWFMISDCFWISFGPGTDPALLLILFFLVGRHSSKKPNAPSFQIGSRWNFVLLLFK